MVWQNLALSEKEFLEHLNSDCAACLSELLMVAEIDSTNSYLQRLGDPDLGKMNICIADHQTAGKGRRGNKWENIYSGSLLYSISWMFAEIPKDFAALSLAVAVEIKNALNDFGFSSIQLKWPNDILVDEAKLGGILLEAAQRKHGVHLVCGIGINVLKGVEPSNLQYPVISLQECPSEAKETKKLEFSRNHLAAIITNRLLELFQTFSAKGFTPWFNQWQAAHAFADERVKVTTPNGIFKGKALGINSEGAYQVDCDGDIKSFISNEFSIRKIIQ